MAFPVNSTSVLTVRMNRAIEVMQRRDKKARQITSCGVFVCKTTVNTTLYSAHAYGDAGDFMIPVDEPSHRLAVAEAVVKDATQRTIANRGRKTKVCFVIVNDKQWTRDGGWAPYSGVAHTNHVHVGCSFSTTRVPKCDGGTNYAIPYVRGG